MRAQKSPFQSKKVLCFQTMTSADFQSPPPWSSSIWPPDGFIHSASGVENRRGVAVAPVAVHASLRLAGRLGFTREVPVEALVQGGIMREGERIPARNHRELVGAGRGPVVEIWRAAGLEGSALALGGARVRRGKVGVVVGAAQRHGGGDRRGVGEGTRVVHPRAGEPSLCEGGQARELALKLTREGAQVRGT